MVLQYDMTAEQFRQFVDYLRQDIAKTILMDAKKNAPKASMMLTDGLRLQESTTVSKIMGPMHAIYVEYGRQPGMGKPPYDAIEAWVDAKGFVFESKSHKHLVIEKIRENIAKNGLPANRYLYKTIYQDLVRKVPALINSNLLKVANQAK